MAIVTPSLLTSLMTGFSKNYQDGLGSVEPQYTQIATVIQSTTKSNTYGWLGKFPSLKKWVSERDVQSMAAHGYAIVNDDWEATVGVDRNDIEDDNLGIYAPMFVEMGRSAAIHPDELVFDLLSKGFATTCYDGQFFFDTDHPVYPKVDGTGTAVSTANMVTDAQYTGAPWFVLDTSKALKPLIFQQRKVPQFVSMDTATDEAVFMKKQFRYGIDSRDAVGFGFWQLAFGNKRELNADNLWDTITKMRGISGDGAKKLSIKPTVLVVPPSLEKVATQLLFREVDTASTNELKDRLQLLVADYL